MTGYSSLNTTRSIVAACRTQEEAFAARERYTYKGNKDVFFEVSYYPRRHKAALNTAARGHADYDETVSSRGTWEFALVEVEPEGWSEA